MARVRLRGLAPARLSRSLCFRAVSPTRNLLSRLIACAALTAVPSCDAMYPDDVTIPSYDQEPDLIPVVPEGLPDIPTAFCQSGPTVVVAVKNRGGRDAGVSMTTIEFRAGAGAVLQTPEIEANATVVLQPVEVPPQCFEPDCFFRITVDWRRQVSESNEDNNVAEGKCLGSMAVPR